MWDMTTRRLFSSYGLCERLQCFQFLGKAVDVSKRRKIRTHRHSITSQKNWIFSNADVKNSDLVFRAFVLRAVFHLLPKEGDASCLRNSGFLLARLQNWEKSLLTSSCLVCLCVCPSAWNHSAPTGRIFMKFDIWVFFAKIYRETSTLIKIWQE
jgi:hypothetical protein